VKQRQKLSEGPEVPGKAGPKSSTPALAQALIVGQLVKFRYSQLDNAGYSVDQKAAKKPMDPKKRVDELIKEDGSREIFNSLVGCLFAMGVYTEDNIVSTLSSVA
jgi:aldehyde:ferredoxin oxidoreductase